MNAHVPPPGLPYPITGPIVRSRSTLDALNKAAKQSIADARQNHRDFLDRVLISHLSGNAFKVMSAITTRTIPFAKFGEVIPVSEFRFGIRDPEDITKLKNGKGNLPIFTGLNIQPATLRSSIRELEDLGLITKFEIFRKGVKPVHAYAPMGICSLYVVMCEYSDKEHFKNMSAITDKDPELWARMAVGPMSSLEEQFCKMFWEGYQCLKEARAELKELAAQLTPHLAGLSAIRTEHR